MTIETKYDTGSRVYVLVDGFRYIAVLDEVRVLVRPGTIVVTMRGMARATFTKPDGKKYIAEREWIGSEENIIGVAGHEDTRKRDTAQAHAPTDASEDISF